MQIKNFLKVLYAIFIKKKKNPVMSKIEVSLTSAHVIHFHSGKPIRKHSWPIAPCTSALKIPSALISRELSIYTWSELSYPIADNSIRIR